MNSCWFFLLTPNHFANSVVLQKSRMFQKSPVLNRTFWKTFRSYSIISRTLLNRSIQGCLFRHWLDSFGENCHFTKAYIPLNSRAKLENPDYRLNADGIPCCPHDETLPMKYEGTSKLKSGVTRYKFVCPKIKWEKTANTGKYKRILESFYPPPIFFVNIFRACCPAKILAVSCLQHKSGRVSSCVFI